MSKSFRIRRGTDIRLVGEASQNVSDAPRGAVYAMQPTDFHGLVPKLVIKEGATVQAGSPLFYDKYNDRVQFTSPVSGTVKAIVRGAKRRILEVQIEADGQDTFHKHNAPGASGSREAVTEALLASGMWPSIQQRPFSVVANPADAPKAIFVSGFDSAPLAPDPDFVMQGREADFQNGMKALVTLAAGKPVHLGVRKGSSFYTAQDGMTISTFDGPHPAGNIGLQIHRVSPINKGEVVWTVRPQDVANIGRFLETGEARFDRTFAIAGSKASNAQYLKGRAGQPLQSVASHIEADNVRVISGDALSGTQTTLDGFLGFYDHLVTALPEGHDPQFFLTEGWLSPGLSKFSLSRAFPTWLLPKSKKFDLNTNMNGEPRAFVVTGQYDAVFPFDIYPVHLVKAIMVNDIDAMEKLGIYEVAPEDFALCEYACTSKIEVQRIVREGLDVVQEECA